MSTPRNSFNLAADKVVALKEWSQKTRALYKSELSFKEKLFLNLVDRPLSVIAGIVVAVKDIFNKESLKGVYFDIEHRKTYVSGACLAQCFNKARNNPLMLNCGFQAKINGLAEKAFEQCEDHSQKPIMKTLKVM